MSNLLNQAARNENPVAAAVAYAATGYSVLPLRGKKPALKTWEQLQQRRADVLEIGRWRAWGWRWNVGIICGAVSDNLVVIDLDGLNAVTLFESAFPDWLATFTVITGSGQGKHLYYHVQDLPPTTRVMNVAGGNLELRANGCYVVAPPSIHPDTQQPYRVERDIPPMRLRHMNPVKEWLYQFIAAKQPKPQPGRPPVQRTMSYDRAARAALFYECRDVAASQEGARNETLHRAAYNLGQLVGDGFLSETEVVAALMRAAATANLPPGEAGRTIQSGLEAGKTEPRSAQWRKRN